MSAPFDMKGDPTVIVEDLSKRFKIYRSPNDRIRDWMEGGRKHRFSETWALRDISLQVARGECIGIIGANGSGKSTLLKILSGVLRPTTGRVDVKGRVLALLELGAGFNPELSGRRNVLTSARLLGFPDGYAAERMADIEAFADIGDAFDDPVRTYSSGMFVRLAFSTFIHLDPDVFIVDEALSVGDGPFQQKCITEMRRFRDRGTTMLLVSHDLSLMREMCDWGIFLRDGRVESMGDMDAAISRYTRGGDAPVPVESVARPSERSTQNDAVRRRLSALGVAPDEPAGPPIRAARLVDENGEARQHCRIGETLTAEAALNVDDTTVTLRVAVIDRLGRTISAIRRPVGPRHVLSLVRVPFRVAPGEYLVRLSLEDRQEQAFAARDIGPVTVYWDRLWLPFHALAQLDAEFEIQDTNGHVACVP